MTRVERNEPLGESGRHLHAVRAGSPAVRDGVVQVQVSAGIQLTCLSTALRVFVDRSAHGGEY
jgi:hypothetical protein